MAFATMIIASHIAFDKDLDDDGRILVLGLSCFVHFFSFFMFTSCRKPVKVAESFPTIFEAARRRTNAPSEAELCVRGSFLVYTADMVTQIMSS